MTDAYRYLIDLYQFTGSIVSRVYGPDQRVEFSGYLHNNKGPDLTLAEYLTLPEIEMIDPRLVDDKALDQLISKAHRELYTDKPPVAISAERYEEMMEVLPPLTMGNCNGVEYFLMSEFTTGFITEMYAACGDDYLCKSVDAYDKATWITRDHFV